MATESYEVIGREVTIHRDVRELRNPLTGEPAGHQRGQGRTYVEGDVIDANDVASVYREALDDSNHPLHEAVSSKLKKVSGEPSENQEARYGAPFAEYDKMDSADLLKVMAVLPSATVQQIKRYEANHQNRPEIVDYSIGKGEFPGQRAKATVEPPEQDENKAVRQVATTEVDDGETKFGEGVTGSSGPTKPFGSTKQNPRSAKQRQGRRARAKQDDSGKKDDDKS